MTLPRLRIDVAFCFTALAAQTLIAQPTKGQPAPRAAASAKGSFQAQGASSVTYTPKSDGDVVEIRNVTFETTWEGVPGRPPSERLLLRKTTQSKQVVGDMDEGMTTTLDAWPLGVDPKGKPLYSLNVEGPDGQVVDNAFFVASRGMEDVDWWSVYKLGSGQHLFDTYVPLVKFSLSRGIQEPRYVGLEVPPDDVEDARLKEPHVVAVVTYASGDKVIREALLTSDDPEQAIDLRAYEDAMRTVTAVETPAAASAGKKGAEPGHAIRISISQSYPSPPDTVTIVIPIVGNDLDLAHAALPAHLHLAAWRR